MTTEYEAAGTARTSKRVDLVGKRVLVTGGTSGIGLASAKLLLANGAQVVASGHDPSRSDLVAADLGTLGEFHLLFCDLGDEMEARAMVDAAAGLLGGLDGLVNSAGAALLAPLIDTPTDEFDRMWDLNVRATFVCIQQARSHLSNGGSIVNIGSDAGLRGEQAIGAYSVSKAALVMLNRLVALDLAPAGIRCNLVCPGATLPGMRHMGHVASPNEGDDPTNWTLSPLGRFATAGDIANAVAFFLSADSGFCTGTELLVDGGVQAGVAG
jgi:NAD(P)-dependent dehydrogenase (short-subunit alcohol dehydrogenase family)